MGKGGGGVSLGLRGGMWGAGERGKREGDINKVWGVES